MAASGIGSDHNVDTQHNNCDEAFFEGVGAD